MIAEEEAILFVIMTDDVKEMSFAIQATMHAEVHPNVYNDVMSVPGFTQQALLVAFGWLIDNKPQSLGFLQMNLEQCHMYINTWITKHFFNDQLPWHVTTNLLPTQFGG